MELINKKWWVAQIMIDAFQASDYTAIFVDVIVVMFGIGLLYWMFG